MFNMIADGRFFATTKKGETAEWRQELRDSDRNRRKDAVKKVIAAMTVGKAQCYGLAQVNQLVPVSFVAKKSVLENTSFKVPRASLQDVSNVIAEVIQCMQTDDLELKKLVYLYLINYAKSQPDLAILAVNTFVKDSQDPNPLIRALAVRTMGCIRVDKITEYLCDPLAKSLKDPDPYVRKTAAICVAKLFDINPELVEDRGFLDNLKDMLVDSNPMVVANAVASLQEIHEISGKPIFQINNQTLFKLQTALNECTEWGQVFILDSLAQYNPVDARDAEQIIERVTPRLQHVNGAVVLSAVKVLFKMMDLVQNRDIIRQLCRKMAPPIVTSLSSEPEVQYVALRNINLIIQKHKEILENEVKVFFCKYNDPIYVKMEKLEIMIKLANENNIDNVLLEFKEYAQEVDVDFVRKSVRAIGRCSISIPVAAERCMNILKDLIETKVNYVVQEAVVVIRDVFRRKSKQPKQHPEYPNKYEQIIATLCNNLDTLDEPEAKASMIWIIGEYAERIDNADELLESFLETFPEETNLVQLQLLTATVKLFLKKPTEGPQKMISAVLSCATQETDNPDLRDRAYIYWRLLSTDPEAAKDVILAEKPIISDESGNYDPALLSMLIGQIGTLSSVYHKPPETFVSRIRLAVQRADDLGPSQPEVGYDDGSAVVHEPETVPQTPVYQQPQQVDDLLGDFGYTPQAAPAGGQQGAGGLDDLLGGLNLGGQQQGQPPLQSQPTYSQGGLSAQPSMASNYGMPQTPGIQSQQTMGYGYSQPQTPMGGGGYGFGQGQVDMPVLLDAGKGQGLQITGRMVRENGQPTLRLSFTNNTQYPSLDNFLVQINNNTFGLQPQSLQVQINAVGQGQSQIGVIPLISQPQKQTPPNVPASSRLQLAIKNNQQQGVVHYFEGQIFLPALFTEDGKIESTQFLSMWKNLPQDSEIMNTLPSIIHNSTQATQKFEGNNIFLLAHRQVPNVSPPQEALYLTGKIQGSQQVLLEVRYTPGSQGVSVAVRCENRDYGALIFEALPDLLQ